MSGTGESLHGRQHSRPVKVLAPIGAVGAFWASLHLARLGWPAAHAGGPASAEEVVAGVLAWSAVALSAWLAIIVSLMILTAVPGALGRWSSRMAMRLTPLAARRALSLALGASVGTVALPAPMAIAATVPQESDSSFVGQAPTPGFHVTLPAPAETDDSGRISPVRDRLQTRPSVQPATPGWLPDRPTPRAMGQDTRLLSPSLRAERSVVDAVTVRRGDTLWSIAARHLGTGATDAQIASEWPRWYAANRAVIGEDPGLIQPGQQLVAPIAEVAR